MTPRLADRDAPYTQDRLVQYARDGCGLQTFGGQAQDLDRDSFGQASTRMSLSDGGTASLVGITPVVTVRAEQEMLKPSTWTVVATVTKHQAIGDRAVRQFPRDDVDATGLVANGDSAVATIEPRALPDDALPFGDAPAFEANFDRCVSAVPTTELATGVARATVVAPSTNRANRVMLPLHRVSPTLGVAPSAATNSARASACQLYPLHDLASIRLAAGLDPLGSAGRHNDELPEHNPLADARQSARLLITALGITEAKRSQP